jgi:hypothetical protein
VLQEKLWCEDRVFIDCDELDNNVLFDYVGSQSETIVVLMSKELLYRPWCIGELVMAHLKCKESQMAIVRFPDFELPERAVIENYSKLVDISCLCPYGISLDMIQNVLRWICDVPPRSLIPARLDLAVINDVRDELVTISQMIPSSPKGLCAKNKIVKEEAMQTEDSLSDYVFIVHDYSNMEMVATGFVLMKLMTPHFVHDASMAPCVLPQGQALPSTTQNCIFVLSNGAFTNREFMHALILAGEFNACFIPIIAEENFRFPTSSMVSELVPRMPALLRQIGSNLETQVVVTLIRDVCKEIACIFVPQDQSSTERLLNVKAKDVVGRMTQRKVDLCWTEIV